MRVLHDVELVFLDHGADSAPSIEAQQGKQLVVERRRNAHVLNRYLDVVDNRFHGSRLPLLHPGLASGGPGIRPMRYFTLVVSALFTVGGVAMARSGESFGWGVAAFFGFCFLVAIFEPWLPKPKTTFEYRLLTTTEEVACECPKRPRESIRWEDVIRIWYVTTSAGPWLPDEWLLFEGETGGCSFPTEATGMDGLWDELKQRFAGFDYKPLIYGGTDDAKHLCWERRLTSHGT